MSAPNPTLPAVSQPAFSLSKASTAPAAANRLVSLDVLRGFDMFWILGADALCYGLARMWKFPPFTWLATQLDHEDWAGLHFYDLIFPLFVFIVGVSVVYSLTRLVGRE